MQGQDRSDKFSIKGFCDHCGAYSRGNLTVANYVDGNGRQQRGRPLCGNCYGETFDPEAEPEVEQE